MLPWRALLLSVCLLAPLTAAFAWEREGSAQFSLSHNYLRQESAGDLRRSWVGQVQPRLSLALRGGKSRLGVDYGMRGQLSVPAGGETVYHQFRLTGERSFLRRRLLLNLSASRNQSILAPERGLVSDYFLSGGNLRDVDQYRLSGRWGNRFGRWALLSLEGGFSQSWYGIGESRRENWSARLSQGSRFRRLTWGLSAGGQRSVGSGRAVDQRQVVLDAGLLFSEHWSLFAQAQRYRYDRPAAGLTGAVSGGGDVYLAGLRYRANRRAGAQLGYQRGFFGRGVTGAVDYRHRRLFLQLSASRDLINGLATLGGGGFGGGAGFVGTGSVGLGAGAGLPGTGLSPGLPGVGVVATRNVLYVSRSERVSLNYQGRRLSQRFLWSRGRFESQADGRVTRYDDWSLNPAWRLGGRTQVDGRVGGRRYLATGVPVTRLAYWSLGARRSFGGRSRLSANVYRYRQVGGVQRVDLRVSVQFQYRLWP